VDYPQNYLLYNTTSEDMLRRGVRSRGFTLYGRLDDLAVTRAKVLERARWREFDLIVVGNIHRQFGTWLELLDEVADTPMAVLDGHDSGAMFPYVGKVWRQPRLWSLPRPHRRARYFKRELTPETYASRCFRLLPGKLAQQLPILGDVIPLAFSVPDDLIVSHGHEKDRDFATHIVDPEVAARLPGGTLGHKATFAAEDDYYADLRRARFGVTTKRGGWDCMRHYEIAASGTVPCFRRLEDKPQRCAPHGLDRTNCISYRDADDLFRIVRGLSDSDYTSLQEGALTWARHNSTTSRAREFLRHFSALDGWLAGSDGR
jgi:hypothetical protein